jgi:hypothetical protein
MNRLLIWWYEYRTLLKVIGGAMVLIGAVYAVVEIPHRQAAPLKAKIQRERDSLPPHERLKLEHDARKLEHDARTALIQGLGGAALLISLLFTWRSIRVTERNLQITQDTAAKNLAIAQDGQITERYTRAVEQLGSDKLEVRLGAIYALERIARDSERDHWPIMEILTAYVREHAAWKEEEPSSQEDAVPSEMQPTQGNPSLPTLAPDIQAVLTVLGRRTHTYLGLNPTSALFGAISTAGPVWMKENSAFSFRIAHHRLVQRPQSSSLSAIAIPRDERYGWRTLSFLSL